MAQDGIGSAPPEARRASKSGVRWYSVSPS